MPYELRIAPNRVDALSSQRLPFEPKGWHLELRNDIRKALLSLTDSQSLYARYSSEARDRCDAENILFYNVGMASFSRLSGSSLVFERNFELVDSIWPHHAIYSTDPNAPRAWRKGNQLAIFEAELGPRPRFDAASAWADAKKATVISTNGLASGAFGMAVTIYAPPGSRLVLASVLKGVVDGVISAFHCHDGRDLGVVSQRLALALGEDPATVSRLLMDATHAVLGSTRLIWPYRVAGVQWSPNDDLCVVGEIHRTESVAGWRLTGSLFDVVPS